MNTTNENNPLIALIVGAAIGAMMLAVFLSAVGRTAPQVRKEVQAEAVRLGYGHFTVDADNQPVFRWNKPEGCWTEKKKHSKPSE